MPSSNDAPQFHPLNLANVSLPSRFTFPFFYQPHPLAIEACQQLQQRLTNNSRWNELYDVDSQGELTDTETPHRGKMFGVLVVTNASGELGYLSGFSGKIDDSNHHSGFVPPVYDMLADDSFFADEMTLLNRLRDELDKLTNNPKKSSLEQQLLHLKSQADSEIKTLQADNAAARAERKLRRNQQKALLSEEEFEQLQQQLGKQSVEQKRHLSQLKHQWQQQLASVSGELEQINQAIAEAHQARADQSNLLQHKLFAHYSFLNAEGHTQDLNQIFDKTAYKVPPAGAGECAAPKLLQYAYLHEFKPVVMAEFWWGHSPKSEIRHHKQYYPSCMSKCHPILSHMLQGLDVDDNPLAHNHAEQKEIEVVYQDEHLIVVHKPEGMLSVPGRQVQDSAKLRVAKLCPDAENVFVLHRLDMATSGLLVFALSKRANKSLQKQFITREVKKQYVALLDGELNTEQGTIDLPLCGDPYDLPRQKVDAKDGKPALTLYQHLSTIDGHSKVALSPETGRTHQLRVHCAHQQGLALPIVGDHLYGKPSNRLYLHAQSLAFTHPVTKQWVSFERHADF